MPIVVRLQGDAVEHGVLQVVEGVAAQPRPPHAGARGEPGTAEGVAGVGVSWVVCDVIGHPALGGDDEETLATAMEKTLPAQNGAVSARGMTSATH